MTRERLQKEIAGLQKELNKESKKVDKAVMDLGLLEFRVATAEQEKITLDQRIQAHKAELKQQQVRVCVCVGLRACVYSSVRVCEVAGKKTPPVARRKGATSTKGQTFDLIETRGRI